MCGHFAEINKHLLIIPIACTCSVIARMRYGACATIRVVIKYEVILTLSLAVLMQQER
ncbi:hypothetical protein D3C80_1948520 [compost metagenome]